MSNKTSDLVLFLKITRLNSAQAVSWFIHVQGLCERAQRFFKNEYNFLIVNLWTYDNHVRLVRYEPHCYNSFIFSSSKDKIKLLAIN